MERIYHCLVVLGGVIWMTSVQGQSLQGIRGKIVDVETYTPIVGVNISIPEVKEGVTTNEKGEFTIPLAQRGAYKIVSTYLGYISDTTAVHLDQPTWQDVNIVLVSETSALEEVVVTRRRERFSELALLEERKKSNLMLEKIGAQELSRKGVSDAEGALTKMSGVTKSASGANVFVRGLGDRYNSTTLNGLALPSEDPLNKNISLDFFSTDIIQSIAVNKTFNPQLIADVAGANIDIVSKELTEGAFLEIGASSGINTQAIRADQIQRIDGTGWVGRLRERKVPITDLNKYDFKNNWNTEGINNPINSSFSLTAGKGFQLGGGTLNVFLTGNMDSDYKHYEGVIRQTVTDGTIILDQDMTHSEYKVSKTGLANVKYTVGNHAVSFNSMYINDQKQGFEQNYGFDSDRNVGDKGLFRRQHVVDNQLLVNQLLSSVALSDMWKLDLGVGYNVIKADEPDRRTTELVEDKDGVFQLLGESNSHERYYSDIQEQGWSTKAIASYKLGSSDNLDRKVEFGYNGDFVKRDFHATIFKHTIQGDRTISKDNIDNIDDIFNNSTLQAGFFKLGTVRGDLNPFWYTAEKKVNSAVAMGTYQVNGKLTTVLGVRYDNVHQNIVYETNLGSTKLDGPSTIRKNYILPSLNLKYALTDRSNLRAAASMSYTLPQFVETAYFLNTFSNHSTQGNRNLVPVENTNFDVKWELFPNNGELLSVGVFYKNMKNPIARSETGSNIMTFYNVGSSAMVTGAEIEIKKNLIKTSSAHGENILSAGANISYLYTNQKLENPIPIFSKKESALQGASPVLANADVSYLWNGRHWNWTSTVVLNYFSDRIYAIGAGGFKDVIEKGIPMLDFVSSASISKRWGVKLKARNLFNPEIRLERETDMHENIVLESFKRGVDFSMGVSYKF